MRKRLLLFGYGNPDRGDDGAAYHILSQIFLLYGIADADLFSADVINLYEGVDILFNFQLLPEYAELISTYEDVVFIDAHTAELEDEIRLSPLKPNYQYSPFTHHFSPSSCLAVAKSLTGRFPDAWLLSIRGYQFGFNRELSKETSALVNQAIKTLQEEFLI